LNYINQAGICVLYEGFKQYLPEDCLYNKADLVSVWYVRAEHIAFKENILLTHIRFEKDQINVYDLLMDENDLQKEM